MPRILRDSIDPAVLRQFPAALIGGYVDGSFGPLHATFGEPGWDPPQWNTFPGAVLVRIAAFASTNDGHVGDCENGDMTPLQAPGWVRMRRAAGADPTVYHSWSGWAALRDEFARQGVAEPWWWIAHYSRPPQLFTADDRGRPTNRCVAHQYADGAMTGHNYDESLVADRWPGVDQPTGGHTMWHPTIPGRFDDVVIGPDGHCYHTKGTAPDNRQVEDWGGVAIPGSERCDWSPDGQHFLVRVVGVDALVYYKQVNLSGAVEFEWTAAFGEIAELPASGPMGPPGPPYDDTQLKTLVVAAQGDASKALAELAGIKDAVQ